MILACQNISKAFGTDTVIANASFHIEEHEKTAIVGINGAGKSTLLKIIVGELPPDSGEVIIAKGKSIGYLAQYQPKEGTGTIYEEVLNACEDLIKQEEKLASMEAEMQHVVPEELEHFVERYLRFRQSFESLGGLTFRSEIGGVLKGLGFTPEEFDKPVADLSGGQKTRVALGKLLVTKPDIILLDEPTNHLDMESIAWLEGYLMNYKGAVILVAHDRYFLDRIVTKVVEIAGHKAMTFVGNYTAYAKKKEEQREALLRQYYNQQREIRHQEEVIAKLRSFNREKSIKRAESREKALEKIERLERPTEERADMRIALEPAMTSGNDVLSVEKLAKAYEKPLFSGVDMELRRGEHVALIGSNGTGKTTILKIINGIVEADEGTVKLGTNVQIGYYDQEHQNLDSAKTLFEELSDAYPNLDNTRIRNVLAAFLFTEDDVFKRIADLSGGERGRVSLAKLMLSNANFLILDEPTNHLDILSKEILEDALNSYTGTVLYVSHDRYFINRTAHRILELKQEQMIEYLGNYDYYLEKKDTLEAAILADRSTPTAEEKPADTQGKQGWEEMKRLQAAQRKRENELKKIEDQISAEEEKIGELQKQMADPAIAANAAEQIRLHEELTGHEETLSELYERWEVLSLEEQG
ncbi:MAG: ABC-F family ATP-binding cassette domain-containing protein [Lachnospiraceae bacterium]|nr:ABC-F family ATP-binding cassette domain-containing protein [Lachnospiraceae bacterium]